MKGTFLLLDNDFIGTLKTGNIKDGKVVIDGKEFILSIPTEGADGKIQWSDAHPISLKGMFGKKDLWILKWSSLFPVGFVQKVENSQYVNPYNPNETINVEKKDIDVVTPSFKNTNKILPEILASTHDLRFLKSMKKYAGGEGIEFKKVIPVFAVILVVGIIGYIWYYYISKKK